MARRVRSERQLPATPGRTRRMTDERPDRHTRAAKRRPSPVELTPHRHGCGRRRGAEHRARRRRRVDRPDGRVQLEDGRPAPGDDRHDRDAGRAGRQAGRREGRRAAAVAAERAGPFARKAGDATADASVEARPALARAGRRPPARARRSATGLGRRDRLQASESAVTRRRPPPRSWTDRRTRRRPSRSPRTTRAESGARGASAAARRYTRAHGRSPHRPAR